MVPLALIWIVDRERERELGIQELLKVLSRVFLSEEVAFIPLFVHRKSLIVEKIGWSL